MQSRWEKSDRLMIAPRPAKRKPPNEHETPAIAIENSAGFEIWNSAEPLGWPSVASRTAGEKITPASAPINPRKPPMNAPCVVIPLQKKDMTLPPGSNAVTLPVAI